jgi:hypothetical protein
LIKTFNKDYLFSRFNSVLPNSSTTSLNKISYSFSFVSLVTPSLINNASLQNKTLPKRGSRHSRLLLKQSYLLFTWFHYMKFLKKSSDSRFIKFSFLPSKTTSYTLTKAPMAHKTNSKEQFKYKFFKFNITFISFVESSIIPSSRDESLLTFFLVKTSFPVFETNLLLLKSYRFVYSSKPQKYFNLRAF